MGGSNSRRAPPPLQRSGGAINSRGPVISLEEKEAAITSKNMQGVVSRLTRRREFLEKKAATSRTHARKLKNEGNKRQALLHLRRMKQFQRETLKLDNIIMRLEGQQLAIESAGITSTAVGAIRTGLETQKDIAKNVDPDKIQEDLDEIQDLIQDTEEVTQIISQNFDEIDEDDLLEELNEIDEGEVVDANSSRGRVENRLPSPPTGNLDIHLPPVPAGRPRVPVTGSADTDEEALKKLEAAL